MKQLITILAASLLFFSCNKKEKYEKDILGMWVGGADGFGGFNSNRDTMRFAKDSLLIWSYVGFKDTYKYYYKCGKFELKDAITLTLDFETNLKLNAFVRTATDDYIINLRKIQ